MSRIGIVGGTGDLGRGLAVRLSKRHDVVIGSRDATRATEAASEIAAASGGRVSGASNEEVVRVCGLAILAVPDLPGAEYLRTLQGPLAGKLVVSPIVPMKFENGVFSYTRDGGSAAEEVAAVLAQSRVAAAFHTVPARRMAQPDERLDCDVLVAADGKETYAETAELISTIEGLRPLRAGNLHAARYVERLTPLLLNIGRMNHLKEPSLRVV
jgi:NADPH-dependent F420 reductase